MSLLLVLQTNPRLCDRYAHANANAYADSHPATYAHAYRNTDGYPYSDAKSDAHAGIDSGRHHQSGNPNREFFSHAQWHG